LTSADVIKILKGKEAEEVRITIYRKQQDSILTFNFKRGNVNITSVPAYHMINKNIGFIKIDRFARNTFDEFHQALLSLKEKGMQTLVLDLRGNTGGYMDVANAIADEFLKDNQLIVFTKNKKEKIIKSWATKKGDFEEGKLYVLIDEDSASASEIIAGALQDNDKGTIIGRRSFGKGLVQKEMDLGDGSAIRLTTARYYTPTGRSIQKPYNLNGDSIYQNDKMNRLLRGEFLHKDSIPINTNLKYTTPKGKTVYGGGGIIPDVFVPKDTTLYYANYHFYDITNFVFETIDKDRAKYNAMTWKDFDTSYHAEEMLKAYQSLKKYHKSQNQNTSFMKLYLKALFARELFGQTGFYQVWQKKDKMIKKVLELENH